MTAKRFTKKRVIEDLDRRITWFENAYGFRLDRKTEHETLYTMYGRYLALTDMRYQLEHDLFFGGYVS